MANIARSLIAEDAKVRGVELEHRQHDYLDDIQARVDFREADILDARAWTRPAEAWITSSIKLPFVGAGQRWRLTGHQWPKSDGTLQVRNPRAGPASVAWCMRRRLRHTAILRTAEDRSHAARVNLPLRHTKVGR